MAKNEVKLTRILKAPIENVWHAWTKPENMKNWFSPEGMTNPEIVVDLKKGGTYRIVMEGHNMPDPNHNGKMAVGGEYIEINKPNLLKFSWRWEGVPVETHTTIITINLKKIDENSTELTLIHNGFADEKMRSEHNRGWISTFNKLDLFLK